MSKDAMREIEAMKIVADALDALDPPAQARVLNWACAKYKFPEDVTLKGSLKNAGNRSDAAASETDLPSLFASATPKTGTDKTLLVAHWFQVKKGFQDFDAQQVNAELKHLGHGVANITRTLEHLMEAKPQLVIQTRKSGTSKQARKKYRVTAAGEARVAQLLSGAVESNDRES
jgi:hypothetical protein